jgi:hypothetical protein
VTNNVDNKSYLATSIIVIIILSVSHQSLVYGLSSPSVYSKDSAPYGMPYTDWMNKWWQWHISLPTKGHPFIIRNLENCPVGNFGQVSFLTNSIQGESRYTCTIPAGHAILLRIAAAECSTPELPADQRSPADYIKCATEGQQYLTFEVTVDGVRINGLEQNNALAKFFNITIPEDNVYNIKSGTYKSVSAGYFAFLKPLPVGQHTISIAARVVNPVDPSFNFAYHTLFNLKVQ